MNKYFLILLFLILGLNANSQSKDIIVRDSVVDMFGYLCRYFYKVEGELYETCIFLPSKDNNIDEYLHNHLITNKMKMLFKSKIESYLFNEYIHSLNYYVIIPETANLSPSGNYKNMFYDLLPDYNIPSGINRRKSNILLFSGTTLIPDKRIKEGIFMIYFGRQKLRGTVFEIRDAYRYFDVTDDFMIDIRRGLSTEYTLAKYHRSKTNEYLYIDFVY
ncbi:hypothetical protein [Vallitalea sp.]|jgi:hypothetical protein|uniref:hypothetical protein n=1 Tax=Vallitalea sp. TaxID=1882829 RepID=UPI0025E1BE61|nr:hypothetical protein [Vallitalea sp.]MCT4685703.1 hypothetical protein [Vallitalea sp.]